MTRNGRIAVLGASGLVGSAIIRKLVEKGYSNVIGTYHTRKPSTPYPIPLIPLDLTDQSATEKFFQEHKPEYLFLAAAKVGGILANNTYKAEFIYENMAIALNVIHSAYKYGVKKLLNLGSSCIYPKHCPQPMKEEYLLTGSLEPTNEPYAIAKISGIKLCRYYNEQYGTNFISVMPTNLYGPNDNFNLETSHVLPALIRKFHLAKLLEEGNIEGIIKDLKKHPIGFGLSLSENPDENEVIDLLSKVGITIKNPSPLTSHVSCVTSHLSPVIVTLWGTGSPYREFLHVDDAADGCVFLMERVEAEDMKKLSQDYFVNLGSGEDLTIKDLAYLIKNIIGFRGKILWDTTKPDGTPRKLLDVSKIKALGWEPKISLEEGIRRVYEEVFVTGGSNN
ncbi:MAG: GDP-L-fucose synthase [Rikenellaceae bacterium]|nr:GDP-L-fucose synthase [Rikenellaceae bacterium]